MSWEIETTTTPVAKKEYHCEASDWIDNCGGGEGDFEPEDWAVIQNALAENNKILIGTRYIKTHGKFDGEFSTYRCREDLNSICVKYDLYDC